MRSFTVPLADYVRGRFYHLADNCSRPDAFVSGRLVPFFLLITGEREGGGGALSERKWANASIYLEQDGAIADRRLLLLLLLLLLLHIFTLNSQDTLQAVPVHR